MSNKDLPTIGGSYNSWGQELNEFLTETHEPSGAGGGNLKSGLVINTPNLNEEVDLTATSTELNTLTDGTTGTDASPLHRHTLANGAADVTVTVTELNTALEGINIASVTASNLTELTSGGNADALHLHSSESKVKVSSDDTTSGYLFSKLAIGSNITLTETATGSNETVTIGTSATPNFTQIVLGAGPTSAEHAATKQYVDLIGSSIGTAWVAPVITKTLTEAPTGASLGERYLVGTPTTSGDAWYLADNNIAEYSGATWNITASGEGQATWVEDEDVVYVNNGSGWFNFAEAMGAVMVDGTVTSANLTTLTDGSSGASVDALHMHAFAVDGANINEQNTWTKAQVVSQTTLTVSASAIAVDASLSNIFIVELDSHAQLDNPTNLVAGGTYVFHLNQDSGGTKLLTYDTLYKFPSGNIPLLSTGSSEKDTLTCIYDGTILRCSLQKDFS